MRERLIHVLRTIRLLRVQQAITWRVQKVDEFWEKEGRGCNDTMSVELKMNRPLDGPESIPSTVK